MSNMLKGDNFLSSIDLTLTNPNSTKPFQVTITYIVNDLSQNYTGNQVIRQKTIYGY